MNLTLKSFLLILFSLSFFSGCNKDSVGTPNFVIIQLDDLGYDDLSINGNTLVESPNIDSLGYSSMRFEQFYVNPVCAPTRASLLTGRHFIKTGVSHVHGGKDFISLDETLLPEALKANGYATGMWGKWHSGHSSGYFPWERGFDEAYMAQLYRHRNSYGKLNGKEVKHNKWADQVITDYAIDFIERNKEEPFLAYLSFLSIHAPLDTPDSLKQKYLDKDLSYNLATLYGMVEHLDHYIGKFLHSLDTMGLGDNTVIFFMSDNGPAVINDLLSVEDRRIRNLSGMKGHKGNIWENGVRSPLFIKWRGMTQEIVRQDLVDITDIMPTILKLAKVELPENAKSLDGLPFCEFIECSSVDARQKVSFNYANRGWPPSDRAWTPLGVRDEYRPVPENNKEQEKYEDQIISVRKGGYKLLHNPGNVAGSAEAKDSYVLIDMLSDPLEEINLYETMPELSEEMIVLLEDWWKTILAEPSSFKMPVFKVDIGIEETCDILAKGAAEVSKRVYSAYSWLTNWKKKGDYAIYNLDVKHAGLYEISINYSGKPNDALLEVSTTEDQVSNQIMLYDNAILGSIHLKEGSQQIRLELLKNPRGTETFDRLNSLTLRRR